MRVAVLTLLLVEDDTEVAACLTRALSEMRHSIDHPANGRDGLLKAASDPYDVIVLDRMLSQVDGLSIVRTIRASGVRASVLVPTALDRIDDRLPGRAICSGGAIGADQRARAPAASPCSLSTMARASQPRSAFIVSRRAELRREAALTWRWSPRSPGCTRQRCVWAMLRLALSPRSSFRPDAPKIGASRSCQTSRRFFVEAQRQGPDRHGRDQADHRADDHRRRRVSGV